MKLRLLALAGLLALPSLAAAQGTLANPLQLPRARFAVTPFVGVQVPYEGGDQFIFTESGVPWAIREQRAGAPLGGVEVEARAWGPLSVLGSVAFANPGDSEAVLRSLEGDVVPLRLDGPDVWMGRVAVAYRLPEPDPDTRRFHPAGFLLAGPALVRLDYDDQFLGEAVSGAVNNWGINFGFHAASTLGTPRVALHLGVEDFLTFWDTDRLARRDEVLFGDFFFQEPTIVDYDYSASNILTLRAGLSIRF